MPRSSRLAALLALTIAAATPAGALAQGAPGTPGYLQLKQELQLQAQSFEINDEYFARLMHGLMQTHDHPMWLVADALTGSGGQLTSLIIGEVGVTDWLGLVLGLQLYLLNNELPGTPAQESDGMNMFFGTDLYLPVIHTKVFAGVNMFMGDALRRYTPAQIEDVATGRVNDYDLPQADAFVPYIFIDSPITDLFRARANASYDTTLASLAQLGLGAFLSFYGVTSGATFDTLKVFAGRQNDVGFELSYPLDGGSKMDPMAPLAEKLRLKIGRIFYSVDDGVPEPDASAYVLAEGVYQGWIFGASFREGDGPGLRGGYVLDFDGIAWIGGVLHYHYVMDTTFGPRSFPLALYITIGLSAPSPDPAPATSTP